MRHEGLLTNDLHFIAQSAEVEGEVEPGGSSLTTDQKRRKRSEVVERDRHKFPYLLNLIVSMSIPWE